MWGGSIGRAGWLGTSAMHRNPWFDRHLVRVPMTELGVSAVTGGESCYGLTRRPSAPMQATIETYLLALTIFPWDAEAAQRYGSPVRRARRAGSTSGKLRWDDR